MEQLDTTVTWRVCGAERRRWWWEKAGRQDGLVAVCHEGRSDERRRTAPAGGSRVERRRVEVVAVGRSVMVVVMVEPVEYGRGAGVMWLMMVLVVLLVVVNPASAAPPRRSRHVGYARRRLLLHAACMPPSTNIRQPWMTDFVPGAGT